MQNYSYTIDEKSKEMHAFARAEDINASYKDLTQVCARVRGKPIAWAVTFLEKAKEGSIPVLYKKFNTKLGHRKELQGQKGRYPKKAAGEVLKVLKSAQANAKVKGISDELVVVHISANKKATFPRGVPKGRRGRADYETARVEVVVKGPLSLDKKVEVRAPEKKQQKEDHTHGKETHEGHEGHSHEKAQVPKHEVHKEEHKEVKHEAPKEIHTKPVDSNRESPKKVALPKKGTTDSATKKVPLAAIKKEKKEE